MPSRAQRERSDRHRALRALAGAPDGVTEALMLAHGFRVELLVDLCLAGLATAKPEHVRAGGRTMEVVRMKITEAGRQALIGKGTQ
jgi:tRNA pseudouridine-54 N-methylase